MNVKRLWLGIAIILTNDDNTNISERIMTPNLQSGFGLVYYPQSQEEFGEYMRGEINRRISSFSLYGSGLDDLSQEIIVKWYAYE